MTKILDYIINHNRAFNGWTHYEKWEYREEVIEGMKDKLYTASGFIFVGAMYAVVLLVGIGAI